MNTLAHAGKAQPCARRLRHMLAIATCAVACIVCPAWADGPAGCGPSPSGPPTHSCGAGPASLGGDPAPDVGVGNPINVVTGNKYEREEDLPALPGVLGLELVRHYNSTHAGPNAPAGILGRGWALSYETRLHAIGHTVQILQADGRRLIFARDPTHPSLCSSDDPAQGQVLVQRDARGERYTWVWADGRRLSFDAQGKLTQILAPTGEFVSLRYSPRGHLLQVTDPQGRSLLLNYPYSQAGGGFAGVQSIDTPVGRYRYDYGSALPAGSTAAPGSTAANLVAVTLPAQAAARAGDDQPGIRRLYHYEDPRWPTLLTGISVIGRGSDGEPMNQRVVTWAYDRQGRANLSVMGEPARLQTGADGQPLQPRRLVEGTGIEQVTLRFTQPSLPGGPPGQTVLQNALGQTTVYTHQVIGGRYRLLQVRGAGCASCGEANVRYGYDAQGRLTDSTRLNDQGQPVQTLRRELDAQGRLLRLGSIDYDANGKARSAQWLARYEYPPGMQDAQGLPQVPMQPALIAMPSVVPGRERLTRLERNEAGQITRIAEEGFSPIDDQGRPSPAGTPIRRSTSYGYGRINGRSVLTEIDGPLANGPRNEPADSDITHVEWDSRGNHIRSVVAPMNLRQVFHRDDRTGRPTEVIAADGMATRFEYAGAGAHRPSAIERAGRRIRYRFDARGRLSEVADAPGRGIRLRYDAGSRLVAVIDAQGYKAETTLDPEGQARVAGLYEPGRALPLRATYRWYDAQRRLTRQLHADGRLDSWRYDDTGVLVEHIDGDDVLHLYRTHGASGVQADIQLTPDGFARARLTPPGPSPTQGISADRRDDFGRVVLEARPGQGIRLRRYDAADRLLREDRLDRAARPAGHRELRYDIAGRLTQQRHYDVHGALQQTLRRRYEGARLLAQSDDTQAADYTYDGAGRLGAITVTLKDEQGQPVYTARLVTAYDVMIGAPEAMTLADGHVMRITRRPDGTPERVALHSAFWAKLHDSLGRWLPEPVARLAQGRLPATVVAGEIRVHPFDGISGYTLGNGLVTERRFDIAGRLTTLRVAGGGSSGSNSSSTLRYGIGPRIRGIEDRRTGLPRLDTRYDYDGFGALTMQASPRIVRTARDPATPAAPIERDHQGRTASDGTYRYTYTPAGQVESVSQGGQPIARYRYNALGQRVSKTLHATKHTTYYLWHQGKLVAEIEDDGEPASPRARRARLSVQYLYLGAEGRAAPIAKLEAAEAPGNRTGAERLLYVHGSYRGEPLAMSDEHQRVVWHARPDAWGHIDAQALQGHDAVMNLRLPGQYHDAETGLHDNWHRSYDPRPDSPNHGRYLSPDPLGYPDGPDAYAYVGGDPVNSVDPLGLYEIDVHYYMTYFLATMAGMRPEDAQTLALATQYVDDNDYTRPIRIGSLLSQEARLKRYHFVLWDYAASHTDLRQVVYNTSPDLSDPLGKSAQLRSLRSYATSAITGACAAPNDKATQFMGEFLHAFMDTYGHRDRDNVPIGINAGAGHLAYGHDPDLTYNHTNPIRGRGGAIVGQDRWNNNEARTLTMEQNTYNQIVLYMTQQNFYASGRAAGEAMDFTALLSTLTTFNRTPEDEHNTDGFNTNASLKREALDDFLRKNGLPPIPPYDVYLACENRKVNLGGLSQAAYPGAILGTPSTCPAKRPGAV